MKNESISSKTPKLEACFSALNLEEHCAVALEEYLSGFATDFDTARSKYHAETSGIEEQLNAVKSALRNSQDFERELATVERNAEVGITDLDRNAWSQIDGVLGAEEVINNPETLKDAMARQTECIRQAEDDKEQARRQFEKAIYPKWPAISRRGFWTMSLIASSLILGIDLLFARFSSLTQTELLLVIACDIVSVLALALAPKKRNPAFVSKSEASSKTPLDYGTEPVAIF